MANQNAPKPSSPKPTDPLELMKQGDKPAGTPVAAAPVQAPKPAAAPTPIEEPAPAEPPPAPPAPPPPPAKALERYVVVETKRVLLDRGRHATWLQKGSEVTSESHDIALLREQGVKLEHVGS